MCVITGKRPFEVEEVKLAAVGRWPQILEQVGGIDRAWLDGRNHPCPKCGGKDRFRLIDAAAGAVLCNQCFRNHNGDGIAAVQWMTGCTFPEALERVAEFLQMSPAGGARAVHPDQPASLTKTLEGQFGRLPENRQAELLAEFAATKPPITADAIAAAGGVAVHWPKRFLGDGQCVAFPAVDDCNQIRGWILRRIDGRDFLRAAKLQARKTHMLRGSRDGWIVPGGWERVRNAAVVWKVEGLPDALALYSLLPADHAVITNIAGAKSVPPFLAPVCEKRVWIVPDADQPGIDGANRYAEKLSAIAAEVRLVPLPYDVTQDSGKDLRDWLNDGGTFAKLQDLANGAESLPALQVSPRDDGRPEVVLTTDEHTAIDQVVVALQTDPELYTRGGKLVTILHDGENSDGIRRPTGCVRIMELQQATLRERITRYARLRKENAHRESFPAHPPLWLTGGVHCRGHWPGLRPLEGIVTTPILRPDGSILAAPGYDSATGLYLDPSGLLVDVPERPTWAEAHNAAAELLKVFCDFPTEADYHQSAILAAILTGFARHAFDGPAPLFLIDANVRGSGKSLLADAIGLILTGDDLPRMSNPRDDDEARKRITSLALRGDRLCLIDNIAGELGGEALDAALTSTRWQDRVLGRSEVIDLPLCITWLATGNNVALAADTARRVCHIRLNSSEERPEERDGFVNPDLRGYIHGNRAKLVQAALTVLRAFHVAERPQQKLPGWGSFEKWTALIRQTVVWLGLPDLAAGRVELMDQSDTQANVLAQLLACWEEVDPEGNGITAGDLLGKLSRDRGSYSGVLEAILELCGGTHDKLPGVNTVGNKLRHVRGRIVGGRMLDAVRNRKGVNVWKVIGANEMAAGSAGPAGSVSAAINNCS